ncbi:MAG: anion transporter [Tepidisphaeraceae bacterium]
MHSPVFWMTTAIFTVTYIGLAIGKLPKLRVDRAAIAFIGATLMLVFGCLTLKQAAGPESIDYETLFLLFGMMVVVAFLRMGGFFVRVTHAVLDRVQSPKALLAVTILLSGVLSAFLVNDIVCLALTPLVLHLVKKLKCDPLPHLICLATAANIGSTGTITGNPQNMIIGVQSQISYGRFALHLFPVAMLGLAINYGLALLIYRRQLRPGANAGVETGAAADQQAERSAHDTRVHRWLLRKSVAVTLITVILFFSGLPIALVAIGAASVLLLDRVKSERIYHHIDWTLLLMFVGLFIVVHAFQVNVVSGWHVERWDWLLNRPVDLLSLVSAGMSNLVSNVPAVLLFEPIMHAMPAQSREAGWLALAMSSTFAGNLTVLGSVANLIVVERARREGVIISFWDYMKIGLPLTILTLGLGIVWLKFIYIG